MKVTKTKEYEINMTVSFDTVNDLGETVRVTMHSRFVTAGPAPDNQDNEDLTPIEGGNDGEKE